MNTAARPFLHSATVCAYYSTSITKCSPLKPARFNCVGRKAGSITDPDICERVGKYSYRVCPRCGYRNSAEVKNDSCDRRLLEVLLARHGAGNFLTAAQAWNQNLALTMQRERLWPTETERVWVREGYAGQPPPRQENITHWQDPQGRWWRQWEPGSDFRIGLAEQPYDLRDVWVQVVGSVDSMLPAPEWPENNDAAVRVRPYLCRSYNGCHGGAVLCLSF